MSEAFISSYVQERWNVSTIYRQCSAMAAPDIWYYETIVWKWDSTKRERGKKLYQLDSGMDASRAALKHGSYCASLIEIGSIPEGES